MSDGTPTTPAEIAMARTLMAETRRELGLLVRAGVSCLASSFASAAVGEAQLSASVEPGASVTVEVVEQDGAIFIMASRSGRPFLGLALGDAEALRVATQISEILNRRTAS